MRHGAALVVSAVLLAGGAFAPIAGSQPAQAGSRKEGTMTERATGTFEVKLTPQAPDDKVKDAAVGRMTIDKQFQGDLSGTSRGQMLAARTAVQDSAGYVAIEQIAGTLRGRSGTFVLQHSGTMSRGAQSLSITVVPDSGTGGLAGLSGKMSIAIDGGKHSYVFEYSIAKQP